MLKAGVMPGYHPPAKEGDIAEVDPDPTRKCESKLRALLAELHAMQAADATSKALVFTQYR